MREVVLYGLTQIRLFAAFVRMKRYSKGQREVVAKGLVVLANVAAGGLSFGQLLSRPIDWMAFVVGVFAACALYFAAFSFMKGVN